jgi:hypothetical protein
VIDQGDRKTPQEKKRLSLTRDRRNTYGENDKSSRQSISKGKRRGQMQLRRAVVQTLRVAGGQDEVSIEDTTADVAEVQAIRRHKRFKKAPDTPLAVVLERKRARRQAGQ